MDVANAKQTARARNNGSKQETGQLPAASEQSNIKVKYKNYIYICEAILNIQKKNKEESLAI